MKVHDSCIISPKQTNIGKCSITAALTERPRTLEGKERAKWIDKGICYYFFDFIVISIAVRIEWPMLGR
jgi:hypothetical protein